MAEKVDWAGIAQKMATARAEQPPGLQAQWDQAIAGFEAAGREHGVDLTDPAQARAALMGAAVMKNEVEKHTLFPLMGQPFSGSMALTLAVFASFLQPEGRA